MVLSGLKNLRLFPRTVLTLLSLVSLSTLRGQAGDVAGTMPEDYLPQLRSILATALKRSPNVIIPLFEIERSEAYRIRDNSARLPSLGSNLNYGATELSESGDNANRSRDSGFFYQFGLNQAVFHWGALKNQSAIGRINVLLAEKSYAKAYRELGVMLRQSYLDLIVQKARLRHLRESLRLLREELETLRERLATGGVSQATVNGGELRVREMTLTVDRAESDFITARRSFSRVAGIDELQEGDIPDDIPKPVYSEPLATAIASALLRDQASSTLEAEIHDLRVREAMLRYKIERVRLLPKFYAGAGYSLENTTTVGTAVDQRAVARRTINLSANWNIFDGFATRAAKREARASQRAAEARRKAELEALLQEAQALERNLKLDAESLELAEIRRSLAYDGERRMREEAELGNVPETQIERAHAEVLLAEANSLLSRAAFLSRWTEFVSLAADDPVLNNISASHAREK